MARSGARLLILLLAALQAGLAGSSAQEALRTPEIVPASNSVPALPGPLGTAPPAPPSESATPGGGTSVSVETIGPLTVPSGQPLPFEIIVRNAWVQSAAQVRLELPIPPGARFLAGTPAPTIQGDRVTWTIGNLDAGGEQRFKGEMQPAGDGDLVLSPSVSYSTFGSLRARVVRPPFSVTFTGPETIQRGQSAGFRVQVANFGAERLSDVVARIKLPEGIRHPAGAEIETDVGDIVSGQTRTLNLELSATKGGQFVLEASAQAHTGQLAQGCAVVSVGENALAVRLEGPSMSNIGEDVDLRLEVINSGTVAASRARLNLQLPEGLEFVSASGGGTYNPGLRAVAWNMPGLPAGSGAPLAVQVRPRGPGQWTAQAVAAADGCAEARGDWTVRTGTTNRAESVVRAPETPELELEIFGTGQPLELGREATLEMHVRNKGTGAAANVRLGAELPQGLVPIGAEGPTQVRIDGRQVNFGVVKELSSRGEALYRIRVRAMQAGHARVVAELNADGLARPIVEPWSTQVLP